LSNINDVFDNLIKGLEDEDRARLKKVRRDVKDMNKRSKYLKDNVYKTIQKLDEDSISTSHFYVQVLDYLRETTHCMEFMIKPSFEHVDNDFTRLLDIQFDELKLISKKLRDFYHLIFEVMNNNDYARVPDIIKKREILIDEIESYRKKQVKRLKKGEVGSKNSLLYLALLHETKNLLLHSVNLVKAQRDFENFDKEAIL
jgi:Na+/phosphate symporter